jgi:hypothetical protein
MDMSSAADLAAGLGILAPYRCVVLGPRESGRSVVVAAMVQASRAHDTPPARMRVLSTENARVLLAHAESLLARPLAEPSLERPVLPSLALQVTVAGRSFFERERVTDLLIEAPDHDGAALFQDAGGPRCPEAVSRAVTQAERADAVVFCVDASDRRAGLQLSRALDAIEERARVQDPPSIPRVLGDAPRPRRVLVLLTKVDRLVGWVGPDVSPARMAGSLDPLNQAVALLGESTLARVSALTGRPGQAAVALAAPWGFCARTGMPFWAAQKDRNRVEHFTDVEDRMLNWRPFGVRDLLTFLATGDAAGSVRAFRPEQLRTSGWLSGDGGRGLLYDGE